MSFTDNTLNFREIFFPDRRFNFTLSVKWNSMYKKKYESKWFFFSFATVRVWPYSVRYSHPYTLFLQTRMANRSTIHKRGWNRWCSIHFGLKKMRVPMYVCAVWCYAFPIPEGRSIILYCSMCVFVIAAQQYGHASTVYDASHTHIVFVLLLLLYCCCCMCVRVYMCSVCRAASCNINVRI